MRPTAHLACSVLLLALAACSGVDTPEVPSFLKGSAGPGKRLVLPGDYLGSGDRAPRTQAQLDAEAAGPTEAELRAAFEARNNQAAALWQRAEAARDADDKADLYKDIADDFPEYPRAAEARYREGLNRYRARDWVAAVEAMRSYVSVAPVNEHIPEVEEIIYRSAIASINEDHGILEIFYNDDDGLNALRYVETTFPAGDYADDALLALGRHYQKDPQELQRATLYFKELLMRYPDSEWSFEARRALGDTYAMRDQGPAYHAGFVDRDPRENVPADEKAEAHAGPVYGSPELAIAEYDKYLERIQRDPARQSEYAAQVGQINTTRRYLNEELARKDDRIAAWYEGRGERRAARVYRRSARQRRGLPVGSLRSVCGIPEDATGSPRGRTPVTPRQPVTPTQPAARTQPATRVQPNMPSRPATPDRFPGTVRPPPPSMPRTVTTPVAPQPRRPTPGVPSAGAPTRGAVPAPPPPPTWPVGR